MVKMPEAAGLPREKETLILDAAQKRFASYGLNKVTMDEIAADLGMGKASLYYYFATKEELFRRVIEREQRTFQSKVGEILDTDAAASEKLRRYTRQRLVYSRQLINLQAASAQSWLYTRPAFRELFDRFADDELKRLTQIIREGKKRGEFGVKSPEAAAEMLLHALQGLRMRMRMLNGHSGNGGDDAETSRLEREIGLFVDIFLQGIKAEHSKRTERNG
jgi:TetR/AcrR family transcriptional regulator